MTNSYLAKLERRVQDYAKGGPPPVSLANCIYINWVGSDDDDDNNKNKFH